MLNGTSLVALMVAKTSSMFRRYNITNDEDIKKAILQTQAFVSALPDTKGNVVGFTKAKARKNRHSFGIVCTAIGQSK
jgi:hypothetical protein